LFDFVEVHGGADQRAVNRLGRRQASLNRGMGRNVRRWRVGPGLLHSCDSPGRAKSGIDN
jgi:hypothetical protein